MSAHRPLRVALVHPFSWPEVRRGGERYLDDLAWYLAARHHHVDVVTGTTGEAAIERRNGITVRRLPHVRSSLLRRTGVSRGDLFAARAFGALRSHDYDLVHALMPTSALAARLARQRTVFTVLGHPTPDQFGVRPFDLRLFRAALERSNAAVALSAASARATSEHLRVATPGVLPPGVRLDRFRAKVSPRRGPPRILLSADVSDPRKRADLVVRAFGVLLEQRPDARLQISGSGSAAAVLEQLGGVGRAVARSVDDLGAGSLDDVPARYRNATVTVLPSRHEAFGLALVESLASGTPVVCTDDGGMPEIVDDTSVGRVVASDDPSALAAALAQVIEVAADPATPGRCRQHATRWGWDESIGPRHEELYRKVARSA